MKVTITYFDHESLTQEEIVRRAEYNYGKGVDVRVQPESDKVQDLLYFCLQRLITHEQLSAYFDEPHSYESLMTEIKAKAFSLAERELERVVKDNEIRVK